MSEAESIGNVDTVVIGAGVVGLAVARALAEAGREVIVLERNERIGEESSSRNSEVIHAGIYYPTASLKARLCVAGKQALYAYCNAKGIAHSRCGKLTFASDAAQRTRLESIAAQAKLNGVDDLEWRGTGEIVAMEPGLRAVAGLWSPSTGIVDSHGLMLALQGDIEAAGGAISLRSRLVSSTSDSSGIRLGIDSDGETLELVAGTLVNCAGLDASRVAALLCPELEGRLPATRYAKGSYFQYSGTSALTHLLYPLPVDGGLGIHATVDLEGRLRFGPDVEWVESIDYTVDEARANLFYETIRNYWPGLPDGSLQPAYAGVRPKISGPGEAPADFLIAEHRVHAHARFVHLIGIESPGLTAALAIGEYVRSLLSE